MIDAANEQKNMQTPPPLAPQSLGNARIGLVLSGGGFKGAYQIGVWKALKELGVERFSAIAGTSVGALNAVLIANDDLESAEEVWANKEFLRWFPQSFGKYFSGYIFQM